MMQNKPRLLEPIKLSAMKCGNLELIGSSIGGVRTSFIIPSVKMAVDVAQGWPEHLKVDDFFITHGHLDHAAGIPYIISQKNLCQQRAPTFYMPEELVEPMDEILKIWKKIEGHDSKYLLHGLRPGDRLRLQSTFGHYEVECFKTHHRIPSLGYTLFENRKKLNPQLKGISHQEIVERVGRGEDVNVLTSEPLMTFSGDSKIEFLDENEFIRKSKYLFIECTYLDEKKTIEMARTWGHIHLDELIAYLPKLSNEFIVVVHGSSRYSVKEAHELIKNKIPSEFLNRISFLS